MPAPPHADDADEPGLPVAVVARRLGVAPATLRTWDRRYGLGPSSHPAGSHRRYGPLDLARLELMRTLTIEGHPPAEAARRALQLAAQEPPEAPAPRRGGPGGQVLALPGADGVVRGLGRAAMALDGATVLDLVRRELAEHGVVHTWDHVLRAVLHAAGARWAATGQGVEVEHLLSECITLALSEVVTARVAASRPDPGQRPVLLASAPTEQHSLPLYAVAAGLAERGVGSRVLGGSLPAEALRAATTRTGAAAVFVWSQLSSSGAAQALSAVPLTRPPTALVVGGPGWQLPDLPPRAVFASDLPEAVELIVRATGRSA